MALTERLALLVSLDAKGAVQGLSNVGKAAEEQLGKTESRLNNIGRTMSKVGVGMLGSGAVIGGALFKAAQASEEAEASTRKLENSIANNAKLAGHSAKEFTDLAAAIQKKTAADGDDIVAGQSVLAQFGLEANQIKSLTPLVVDLARKKGIDLTSAATAVAKAMTGQSGALKKAGVVIDETAFATDKFTAVQDALKHSVGGFAEAEGKTFAGSLERLKNQLHDIEEGVGKGAVEAFSSLLGPVGTLAEKFGDLDPKVQENIGKFGAIGAGGLILSGTLLTVAGKVLTLKDNFDRLAGSSPGLAKGLGLVAKAGGILAGLQLGGALANLVLPDTVHDLNQVQKGLLDLITTGKASGELASITGKNFDKLASSVGKITDPSNANKITHSLFEPLGKLTGIGTTFDKAKQNVDEFDKALAGLAQRDPKSATAVLDAIHQKLGDKDFERLRGLLNDYDSALAGVDVDSRTAAGGVDQFAGAQGDAQDPTSGLTDEISGQAQALEDLLNATIASFDSNLAFRDAQDKTKDGLAAVNKLVAEGKTGTDEYGDALRDAEGDLLTQAGAAARLAEDQAKANGQQFDATDKARAYRTELINLANSLAPNSPLRTQLQQYIDQLGDIPTNVSTTLSLHLGRSVADIAAEQKAKNPALFGPIGTRAAGGPVMKGSPYLVGENGPEVFRPSGNGVIEHLNNNGPQGGSGGGGFNITNLNVYANTKAEGRAAAAGALAELQRQIRVRGGDPNDLFKKRAS